MLKKAYTSLVHQFDLGFYEHAPHGLVLRQYRVKSNTQLTEIVTIEYLCAFKVNKLLLLLGNFIRLRGEVAN